MLLRCCSECKVTCQDEFKQVVNLKSSGLLIYVYNNKNSEEKVKSKQIQSVVIYNTGNKEVKKFDFVIELCQYKTNCYHCQRNIQRIHNLLDDITIIKRNEVLAICEHCRRSNFKYKCQRCQYLLEKFISSSVKKSESLLHTYRSWWCSVKNVLQNLIDNQTLGNRIFLEQSSDDELNNLINLIKTPSLTLPSPTASSTAFPSPPILSPIKPSQVIPSLSSPPATISSPSRKLKQKDSSYPTQSELDKPSVGNQHDKTKRTFKELIHKLSIENTLPTVDKETPMRRYHLQHKKDIQPKVSLETPVVRRIQSSPHTQKSSMLTATPKKSRQKVTKSNIKVISSDPVILELIKERKNQKKRKEKDIKLPKIDSLPSLSRRTKRRGLSESTTDSESTLVCAGERTATNVMVKGTNIVPLDLHYKVEKNEEKKPLMFRKTFNCTTPQVDTVKQLDQPTTTKPLEKKTSKLQMMGTKGVIKYQLSDREFIQKGWTKLPTTKIMRRMSIYKMIPAYPQYDWFLNHSHERILFYDTGEILAEIYENGCGKWFYKNGLVALDFFNSEDIQVKQRYIIYGDNNEWKFNTKRPITVLACFDHLGNGIVYDYTGKVRLKYNQSEGIVIDANIAPPGRWKWHTLNDPPDLQNAYIDNRVKVDKEFRHLLEGPSEKPIDNDMMQIELENFVKAKAIKMMRKFKPFQIRTKVVKINEYFSLRIIDQANIYVLFRVGHVSLKLNIGMHLKSDEIINTETAEASEVSTPYDTDISQSKSVCDIHEILNNVRNFYKRNK